jgi:hypothetical protein
MSLMKITAESLTQELGVEVPVMYVLIAKHSVLGMESDSIKDVLGCSAEELAEVERDPLYKEVRIHVGAAQAQSRVQQTTGWDAIEDMAMENLIKRLPYEKDGDFLLRVAAVANKAQRRQQRPEQILDPTRQAGRTAITLTERLVKRITHTSTEELQERQLSISDGSMSNPSFDEVDSLLSVRKSLPDRIKISTKTAEVNFDDLEHDMQDKGF